MEFKYDIHINITDGPEEDLGDELVTVLKDVVFPNPVIEKGYEC